MFDLLRDMCVNATGDHSLLTKADQSSFIAAHRSQKSLLCCSCLSSKAWDALSGATPIRRKLFRSRQASSILSGQRTRSRARVNACKVHVSHPQLIFSSFKDAAASIRRTTTEFNYQLVIQRAYEEGEEQLSENDDLDLDGGPTTVAVLIPL